MGYFVVYMESDKNVTNKDRKRYVDSLTGNLYEKKRGTITKFNNSMGYKPVIDDIYTQYPVIVPAKVENPEGYKAPDDVIYQGMYMDFNKKSIVKFIIPFKYFKHNSSKFSYYTTDMIGPFMNFLRKVYPEVKINGEYKEKINRNTKNFVLGFMLSNLNFNEDMYTVECSIGRLLTDKEVFEIEKEINACTSYKCHINQFYCETCKGHNPEAPYHVEIVYD